MAYFELEGKLLRKFTIKTEEASTQLCEFIIEIADEVHPQYVKFQLEQERCLLLEPYKVGEKIKVYFDLRGAEQAGKFTTTLHALNIEKSKSFKFQPELDRHGLQYCPPADYRELKMTSYRFVFQDPSHQNNFLPAYLANPSRVNNSKDSTSKCQGFGLSLYQEEEGAKASFLERMVKTKGNFANLVGDHLAAVELEPYDGVGSEPSTENFSHFTFHEYKNADLTKKVSQIEKI